MADENAAVLISNSDLSGTRLAETIRELIADPKRLTEIETSAKRIAILDAESRIVDLVEAAVRRRQGTNV
jgi:UDP-N-acetylglucosamine:LPS N-acetylglucosamine transferase